MKLVYIGAKNERKLSKKYSFLEKGKLYDGYVLKSELTGSRFIIMDRVFILSYFITLKEYRKLKL